MSELNDRRARKKARTRSDILQAAQGLFAERGFDAVTIADIASAADVAVQTVFNHFPTKEELFFADRTPWVECPAEAVRTRAAGVLPLAALRAYTRTTVLGFVADSRTEQRRRFIELVQASPALRAFELELLNRAEKRLSCALAEAWAAQAGVAAPAVPCLEVRVAASLTAALWLSGASSLVLELRAVHESGADAERITSVVETLAERLFSRLESSLETLLHLPAAAEDAPAGRHAG